MANAETKKWPDLAIGLYDKLTGRNAEITYEFDDFEVFVPSNASSGSDTKEASARWKMNGTLKIRTNERKS